MSIHVAILQKPYLDAVLAGTKTIESRLTKTSREPYRAIAEGERLFLKQSGGPFRATAVAGVVEHLAGLSPKDVEALRQKYQPRVGGDDAYWAGKAACRYAVFITLESVEAFSVGPAYAVQSMRAWYVLPENRSPLLDVVLTSGAIGNSYIALPNPSNRLRETGLTLLLPAGQEVHTTLTENGRIRWRGWGDMYSMAGVRAGDRVRFVGVGDDRYQVSFPDAGKP